MDRQNPDDTSIKPSSSSEANPRSSASERPTPTSPAPPSKPSTPAGGLPRSAIGSAMTGYPHHDESVCTKDLVELWIPTKLVNPLNEREHWNVRSKRAARQREMVAMTFLQALGRRWSIEADPSRPKRVDFLAYVGRELDSDGLQAACFNVRNGLIDARLIDGDAPKNLHIFTYRQVPGTPTAKQGVRISVRLLEPE